MAVAVATQLFRLEQIDAELEQQEAAISEARRKGQRNTELEAAEAQAARLHRAQASTAAEQRSLESDLADLEAKIRRDNARMYGGQIVDPRELASLERELEHLRSRHDEVEERLLEVMERAEELQTETDLWDGRVQDTRARWEREKPDMTRRQEELTESVGSLRAERETLAASLDPASLAMYQRLRSRAGHAVSLVSNGVCQWCRVNIPAKDVQHARSGALVPCTNCGRILYVGS